MSRYQARYTEVLINLIENERLKPLLDEAMSTYPIYTKTSSNEYIPNFIPTREEINQAILDYYKYREIGFETVGRFLDELKTSLNEIMPYYNQLMFSLDQDYDIKFNVDYTREINRELEGTGEASSTSSTQASDSTNDSSTINNYNKHVRSNTPQDSLSITNQNINNVSYADEVTWNHDTNSSTANHTGSSSANGTGSQSTETTQTEGTTERTKGNYGQISVQSLIESYRNLIVNIKQDIIKDRRIAELFMNIY